MAKALQLRKWWGRAAPLVALGAGVAVLGLLMATRPDPPPERSTEPVWVVTSEAVTPAAHAPLIQLFGYVDTPSRVTLKAAIEADVEAVPVREGHRVEADELLVRLDGDDLRDVLRRRQADLDELQAALAQERRAVEADREALDAEQRLLAIDERRVARLQSLLEDGAASPAEFDSAEEAMQRQRQAVIRAREAVANADSRLAAAASRRAAAAALRDQAARDVNRTEVRAPFAGRISRVELAVGGRVSPGAALLSLYDTADLELRAQLPASRIAPLRRAQTDGQALRGRAVVDGIEVDVVFDRLAGRSDRDRGGVEAIFAVDGVHDGIVLERFAELELQLPPEAQSVIVPYEALYGMDRLYRIDDDDRLRALSVERLGEARGPEGRRGALVRSPALTAGTRVVTTQIPQATDGLRVRVAEGR